MTGGLPQLDTAQYPGEIFWLALAFGLLYALMAGLALPAVRRTREKRAGTIAGELAAAGAANDAAKAMLAQYEKALAEARSKAQAVVSEIAAAAARESAEKQAAQQKQLASRLLEAEAKIAAAREAGLCEAREKAGELAAAIVEKVVGERG
jgi:F-type H+-transporting ATPase subunit b